ncbi:hypothetical protein MNB_SV-15-1373 [hydrothermal vent metagenome]|uniref:Uncharacterized protein n=1 Tax=hydrothermal vent metagenome TaxID=652676 RepID=A0A1W1EI15_9ZZZZ
MKIASIISSILLSIWVLLTITIIWFDVISSLTYIKISITIGIIIIAIILISLAIKEYGSEKSLREHNYLD